MSLQRLLLQTQERFPGYHDSDVQISPLEKGGSERKFYRIRAGGENPVILVKYSSQKEENRHYVEIARFLAASGLNVPAIYFHDVSEGLIWMQDLGDEDLWSWREAPWERRRLLYESALFEVSKLHIAATKGLEGSGLRLEREFSEQLYLWEQQYFFDNCLRAHFGLNESAVQYDIASLLYDPYVELTGGERILLLEFYKSVARRFGMEISPGFDECFYFCALQRLMQALGAYGFLGLQKGRPDFLAHIPAARRSLREVAARIDGLDEFVALLDFLP